VLVTPDGSLLGCLPPVECATPWWQEIFPVVEAVRARHGIDITVLRLLEAERRQPGGGLVTYLAETERPVVAELWAGTLDDHPLRMPWARPGGPAKDLAWAGEVMDDHGLRISGKPRQVRTWNLSSIWSIPTEAGPVWLKVVPPFFAHEGDMIERLEGGPVPHLLGHDGPRVLLRGIPGEDLYEATRRQLLQMVSQLVRLQSGWLQRMDELTAMGIPDWRGPALTGAIASVVNQTANDLAPAERDTLAALVDGLPARFAALAECGIGNTLVHGDFHPGNHRGIGDEITILDWGDSGIGHPLLDQPAFFEKVSEADRTVVCDHWNRRWRGAVPGSDPARAAELLAPVAAARQAVIYRKFLDNIEPSERAYHRDDPAMWLRRTAALLRR
jgi:hypothetical protein